MVVYVKRFVAEMINVAKVQFVKEKYVWADVGVTHTVQIIRHVWIEYVEVSWFRHNYRYKANSLLITASFREP